MYEPDRVSTFTRSPMFTNSGTFTVAPVVVAVLELIGAGPGGSSLGAVEVAHRARDVATRVGEEDELADPRDLGRGRQHAAAVALGGRCRRARVGDRERDLEARVADERAACLDGADGRAGVRGAEEAGVGLGEPPPEHGGVEVAGRRDVVGVDGEVRDVSV